MAVRSFVLYFILVLYVSFGRSDTEVGVAHMFDWEESGPVCTVYFVTLNTSTVWVYVTELQNTNDFPPTSIITFSMHIHSFGDMAGQLNRMGLYSSTDHYVGGGSAQHGCEDDAVRHEGDLGNWEMNSTTGSTQGKYISLLSLSGNSSIIGRGVMIHNAVDDCVDSPGDPILFGVVGIANISALPSEVAAMIPDQPAAANSATGDIGAHGAGNSNVAVALLLGTDLSSTSVVGFVMFEDEGNGTVTVRAVVDGLSRYSAFGFHIHTFGHLSSDGMSSGSHYNPSSSPHGIPDAPNRHMGDLGNICTFDGMGKAYYQHTFTGGSLSLTGPNNVVGRTVIIHSKFDSGRSTDFGARIAQGVIGIGLDAVDELIISAAWDWDLDVAAPSCSTFDVPLEIGVATLAGGAADAGIVGEVYFVTVNASSVFVWANISGITVNANASHGLHVHMFGDVTDANGNNAGSHFVGAGAPVHACENNDTRHEGDMGNWPASEGSILFYKQLDLLSLTGENSIIGRGVILHANVDDCANIASSGARLAQGVIGIANPSSTYLPPPVAQFISSFTSNPQNSAESDVLARNVGRATAVLSSISGSGISGVVEFTGDTISTTVVAKITGLNSSDAYGFHIHMFGDMNSQDGTAAGSHFNPFNQPHGFGFSPENRHLGDLGNICSYGDDGTAYYKQTFNGQTLGSPNGILGLSVIVHAIRDIGPGATNFGPRLAQGVIGIANTTAPSLITVPTEVDLSQSPVCAPTQNAIGVAHLIGDSFDSNITGFVYFVPLSSKYTWVWANITQITSNPSAQHGLHIHQLGDTNDKAKALYVGGHYIGVTGQDVHSCEFTDLRHEGDMGNWTASSGVIMQSKTIDLVVLSGPFSVIGRSVVLHDLPDNCVTTSSAGNRLAQGVIGIANPAFLPEAIMAIANPSGINLVNTANSGEVPTKAIAVMMPTANSGLGGVVTFEQTGNAVTVKAMITGLPSTSHAYGFHIHTYGDMISLDGASASTHYNPFNVPHNLPPSSARQVGDLGNLCSFSGNTAYYQYTFQNLLTLGGNTSILGRSVIVHSAPDTNGTSFGQIIAQGIIGYGSPNTTISVPPSVMLMDPACSNFRTTTTGPPPSTTGFSSSTTGNTPTPTDPPKKGSGGISRGAKAAIAFAVLITIAAIITLGLYYNRHKRFPWEKRSRQYTNAIDYVPFEDKEALRRQNEEL